MVKNVCKELRTCRHDFIRSSGDPNDPSFFTKRENLAHLTGPDLITANVNRAEQGLDTVGGNPDEYRHAAMGIKVNFNGVVDKDEAEAAKEKKENEFFWLKTAGEIGIAMLSFALPKRYLHSGHQKENPEGPSLLSRWFGEAAAPGSRRSSVFAHMIDTVAGVIALRARSAFSIISPN